MQRALHIIIPVKDSIETAQKAIEQVCRYAPENARLTVYNDFSTAENTSLLRQMASEKGFCLVNWEEKTCHPSPNYRLTLIDAQEKALEANADLLITESDVFIKSDTIGRLQEAAAEGTGMVAAVTTDEYGNINFPYLYARKMHGDTISTRKRLSFCCTLLTAELLHKTDFHALDEQKNWYDVSISHKSRRLGLDNLLVLSAPVIHKPHSSRPWKRLKYSNPIKYYWLKLIHHRDKI